ncbi:MAG TPA: outer membrane protein assembly factor BamD [Candidatus Binataceae bacterium]|nr:outer membrane protein assembly factor BamD [Candidatus Binataceae bacterium]
MREASGALAWRLIALAAAMAMVAGCAPAQPEMQQVTSNQFALRGLVATDQQQIDALKQRVSQLQDQIEELRHGGAAGGGAGNAQMSALAARVSKLESAVSTLQGGAAPTPGAALLPPGTAPTPGAPGAETGGGAAGMPPAPGSTPPPEFATGTSPPGTEPGAETGGEAAPEAPPAAEGPDWHATIDPELAAANSSGDPGASVYRKGLEHMKAGQYQEAEASLSTLMHRFPKSPLSEPAEYFSANALYESGKYDQAILQFNDLAMRFPKGRFTCAALLREGQAFVQINDRIDARLTLQKLVSDHSDCPEASEASAMMKNLASD